MKANEFGFTLIEILLSISIIALLIGSSLPVFVSFQTRNDLDITTQSIADALRRGQIYARGVSGDSEWGVEIQPSMTTLFKGTSFSARDPEYDEVIIIPTYVSVSGLSSIIFSKLNGVPNISGSITLTSNTNDVRTVIINRKGMVSY